MATKLTAVFGCLAKAETTYNDGTALVAGTDGQLIADETVLSYDYERDGARGPSPAGAGLLLRTTPGGSIGNVTIPIEMRGRGAAYTAPNPPPDWHVFLQAAGFDATFDTDHFDYTPTAPTGDIAPFTSLALELYGRKELFELDGVFCDVGFEVEYGGFMQWAFNSWGVVTNLVSDVALPAITYYDLTKLPPKAESISLTIGGVSIPNWRSMSFAMNRDITSRLGLGYIPGRRAPTLEILMEADARATFDPEALWAAATSQAVAFTIGTVANNKFAFSAPTAQITNVTPEEDGSVALWRVELTCAQSDAVTPDDLLLTAAA